MGVHCHKITGKHAWPCPHVVYPSLGAPPVPRAAALAPVYDMPGPADGGGRGCTPRVKDGDQAPLPGEDGAHTWSVLRVWASLAPGLPAASVAGGLAGGVPDPPGDA